MKRAVSAIPLVALLLTFSPAASFASVIATFTVTRVDDVALNSEDLDFSPFGTPTIELYWMLGIFEGPGPGESSIVFTGHESLVQGQSLELAGVEVSRVVPDSGAFFLLALFDADDLDDDDLIGTHSVFTSTPVSESAISNNDLFPPGVAFPNSEDESSANNFRLSYEVTLEPFGATVPEPSTLFLLGTGLIGIVGYTRRKKS